MLLLALAGYLPVRHALEQYTTRSQSFRHFFRQVNGRLHTGQTFDSRLLPFMFFPHDTAGQMRS